MLGCMIQSICKRLQTLWIQDSRFPGLFGTILNTNLQSRVQDSRSWILNPERLRTIAIALDWKFPKIPAKWILFVNYNEDLYVYIYTYVPWKSNHHFFIGWFPNYHYFSRCLSSSKNVGFQGIYVYTYRYLNICIYIWHHLKRQPNNWPKKRS